MIFYHQAILTDETKENTILGSRGACLIGHLHQHTLMKCTRIHMMKNHPLVLRTVGNVIIEGHFQIPMLMIGLSCNRGGCLETTHQRQGMMTGILTHYGLNPKCWHETKTGILSNHVLVPR